MAIPSHAEGARFYAQVAQAWRAEGYARFDIQDVEVIEMGQDSRMVTFDWLMLRQDGSRIRRWRQSYQLIRNAQDWQVMSSTFHKA